MECFSGATHNGDQYIDVQKTGGYPPEQQKSLLRLRRQTEASKHVKYAFARRESEVGRRARRWKARTYVLTDAEIAATLPSHAVALHSDFETRPNSLDNRKVENAVNITNEKRMNRPGELKSSVSF